MESVRNNLEMEIDNGAEEISENNINTLPQENVLPNVNIPQVLIQENVDNTREKELVWMSLKIQSEITQIDSDYLCSKCHEKLKKAIEPPEKKQKTELNNEDGTCCSICLENWTNVGEHRVSSLKCGHLFGFSCIKRWLTESSRTCPTCKKKVCLKDLRHIYVSKLIAVDTSELETYKSRLECVQQEKNILEQELSRSVVKHHNMVEKVEDLQNQVLKLTKSLENYKQCNLSQNKYTGEQSGKVRIFMEKSLEVNNEGGCRVLDCNSHLDLLIVSTKSKNPLFNGYGVKKFTISSYKPTAFIPLHSKPIRDISFQPGNSNFITVGLDKTVKFVSSNNNSVIISKTFSSPLWSCCWDANNSSIFYVGEQQGSTVQYDVRNMGQSLSTFTQSSDLSPVVSLTPVKALGETLVQSGFLCCKLNNLYFYGKKGEEYESNLLHLPGPFVSMRSDQENQQFLVSSRPNSSDPYSRHSVFNLDKDVNTGKIVSHTIHNFKGGSVIKLLSRSALISGNDGLYVSAYEESYKSVLLWNVATGHQVSSIPAHEPILDLCGFKFNNDTFLTSLTEKKIVFFKYS